MTRNAALEAGRRAALAGMSDRIEIFESRTVWDEATQADVTTETVYFTGPGKIQFFDNAHEQLAVAGAHQYVFDRSTLHLPHDAIGAVVDRLVRVVSSAHAPALIGRVWRIANTPDGSQKTALRLPIEEVIA